MVLKGFSGLKKYGGARISCFFCEKKIGCRLGGWCFFKKKYGSICVCDDHLPEKLKDFGNARKLLRFKRGICGCDRKAEYERYLFRDGRIS